VRVTLYPSCPPPPINSQWLKRTVICHCLPPPPHRPTSLRSPPISHRSWRLVHHLYRGANGPITLRKSFHFILLWYALLETLSYIPLAFWGSENYTKIFYFLHLLAISCDITGELLWLSPSCCSSFSLFPFRPHSLFSRNYPLVSYYIT